MSRLLSFVCLYIAWFTLGANGQGDTLRPQITPTPSPPWREGQEVRLECMLVWSGTVRQNDGLSWTFIGARPEHMAVNDPSPVTTNNGMTYFVTTLEFNASATDHQREVGCVASVDEQYGVDTMTLQVERITTTPVRTPTTTTVMTSTPATTSISATTTTATSTNWTVIITCVVLLTTLIIGIVLVVYCVKRRKRQTGEHNTEEDTRTTITSQPRQNNGQIATSENQQNKNKKETQQHQKETEQHKQETQQQQNMNTASSDKLATVKINIERQASNPAQNNNEQTNKQTDKQARRYSAKKLSQPSIIQKGKKTTTISARKSSKNSSSEGKSKTTHTSATTGTTKSNTSSQSQWKKAINVLHKYKIGNHNK